MTVDKLLKRLTEAQVKLCFSDWLTSLNLKVFDETPNKLRLDWGVFEVRNISRAKKPDLIVCGNLKAANKFLKNKIKDKTWL